MILHHNTLIRTVGASFDPEELVRPPAWMVDAACTGVDPGTFFPERGRPGIRGLVTAAKAVCGGCPVVAECLDFALAKEGQTLTGHQGYHSNMVGIWGGRTVGERQTILRERHEAAS